MTRHLLHLLARALVPLLAVALCLILVLFALAGAGFGRDEGESFPVGVRHITRVVWDRSLLPSPPSRRPERPDEARRENYRTWIQALVAATPILLTGLAVALAFRASVLNIGAEGQYILGAIVANLAGLHASGHQWFLVTLLMIAGFAAGALFASITALLEQWRKVPVVLSSLLLNFVAAIFLKVLLQGPMHEAGSQLRSEELPELACLPHIFLHGKRTDLHIGFFIAIACAILLSGVLRFTTFGFHLRATGANPIASRFAGIRVGAVAVATLCLSGGLAGLAGAIQLAGVPSYLLLPDTASSGYGFTGIAVALLGRLSPLGVVLAALFFGWLQTAFAALETELHVPFLTLQATQGSILIAMLILTNLKWGRR